MEVYVTRDKRLIASLEMQKQTAALSYISWKTAVCYCFYKEASNHQQMQCEI